MESSNIEIVQIGTDELPRLQALGKKTFLETFADTNTASDMAKYLEESFNIRQLKAELENKHSEFFFVLTDTEPVGYLKLNHAIAQNEFQDKNALEIERFYALKKVHGKHIGKALMNKAMERAMDLAVDFVWLGVWEYNHRALRFYQKHGFEVFDKHNFVVGKDVQIDLLMKRELQK